MKYFICFCILLGNLIPKETNGQSKFSNYQTLLREIYKELIEINTTVSEGSTTIAAEAMAKHLLTAGFKNEDVLILGQHPNKKNLIVRLHGTGEQRPLLLLAHIDVVEAKKEDWTYDPFKLTEKERYFYGRGTVDDKAMASIWIANLILYKQEGFIPNRDLIVCLTSEEETGGFDGLQWLLRYHKDLIDAEYCLNEGGQGIIEKGKYLINQVQLSEKIYQSYQLEVTNNGGHSSLPTKENAIYRLIAGINRISEYEFPINLNEGTRTYFKKLSAIQNGALADDMAGILKIPADSLSVQRLSSMPVYNASMRTTCVTTVINAGNSLSENILPSKATAIINCRIIPWESPDKVFQKLKELIADDKISITPIWEDLSSPPSPINLEIFNRIEKVSSQLWPDIPVVPIMSPGATDGMFLRREGINVYGVSGLFFDASENREHGKDERIGVKQLYDSQYFLFQLVKELSSQL